MAQSRQETINTEVSVNYFPRESQWKLRVPLLSLNLAIFIIDSLLSFYTRLPVPAPADLHSADSPREWHPWMSRDVSPQMCHLCPHLCLAPMAVVLSPTMWKGTQHFRKEKAIADRKEGEWLQPGLPQTPALLVSSRAAWEGTDRQTALCKPLLWWILTLGACCLPETLVRRCQTLRKGEEQPWLDPGQSSWRGGVCEAPGARPGTGWRGKLLASQPAFLLPRTAIGGAWQKGEPDLDQQEWAPLTGTTSPLKGWRPSMFICTGNMPVSILPSVMLLCHLQGRATPSEAKPASEGTRGAIQ